MDKYGLQPEIRLHEKGITSNRESPRHGESNLRQVLTTRQALKGVCAISLVFVRFSYYDFILKYFYSNSLADKLRMRDSNWC